MLARMADAKTWAKRVAAWRASGLSREKLHDLDPEEYLRDLFRVLPHWPRERFLELAPKHWPATREKLDPVQLEAELGPLTIPPVG